MQNNAWLSHLVTLTTPPPAHACPQSNRHFPVLSVKHQPLHHYRVKRRCWLFPFAPSEKCISFFAKIIDSLMCISFTSPLVPAHEEMFLKPWWGSTPAPPSGPCTPAQPCHVPTAWSQQLGVLSRPHSYLGMRRLQEKVFSAVLQPKVSVTT